jgi:hypothetical protein
MPAGAAAAGVFKLLTFDGFCEKIAHLVGNPTYIRAVV